MSQENVETVRGAYAAFQSGDVQAALAPLADDAEWVTPDTVPWGGTQRGHQDIAAGWGQIGEHLDDFGVELLEIIDAGDHVVVVGRSKGRAKASGTDVGSEYAQIFDFGGGDKASRVRLYIDNTETQKAIEA